MSERSERVLDAATIVIMTEPSGSEARSSSERSERIVGAATSVLMTAPSGSEARS
ncbi:hypothetical protein ABZV91_25930 [Nocardia sp. NPDC004568]|uniref:hypothetical protein n=1 Tax=Nocardia sp. NPDC004568 TaxID=3154551 RepID=UPI0033A98F71